MVNNVVLMFSPTDDGAYEQGEYRTVIRFSR